MARLFPDDGESRPPPILPLSESQRFRPRRPTTVRFRRFLRSRTPRLLLLLFLFVSVVEVLLARRNLLINASRAEDREFEAPRRERVYIASMHWNNAKILERHWNDAVVGLAQELGPENVFVSVYESGSWDKSKEVLKGLDERLGELGVSRNITLSPKTHKDEVNAAPADEGWVETPKGGTELRRIPYLAALRNRTLRDLLEIYDQGIEFDKVLFLNDVVFTVGDSSPLAAVVLRR